VPHSNDGQKDYYKSLTTSLVDFYQDDGKESGFLGVTG